MPAAFMGMPVASLLFVRGNKVYSSRMKGLTFSDPLRGKPCSLECPVYFNRL